MKHTHVELVYYKDSGKYYSGGEVSVPHTTAFPAPVGGERPAMFHECLAHVTALLNRGERPGLVDGFDFDVLCTVYTEYGPLTHLFVRDSEGFVS